MAGLVAVGLPVGRCMVGYTTCKRTTGAPVSIEQRHRDRKREVRQCIARQEPVKGEGKARPGAVKCTVSLALLLCVLFTHAGFSCCVVPGLLCLAHACNTAGVEATSTP